MSSRTSSFFLDSGAFSASTQQTQINLQEYINFIHDNKNMLDVYACLDVIGDAEKTWENQKEMEAQGLNPLITYHYGEDIQWLKKYIAKYNYIALGGTATGTSFPQVLKHLDRCWDIICDEKGLPTIKVHGFGLTSVKLMSRYPWYSVDSSSWAVISRMGAIIIPRLFNSGWKYDEFSWVIGMTERSPYRSKQTQHYNNLSPKLSKIVDAYLLHKGYSVGKSELISVTEDYKLKQGRELWYKKKEVIERITETGVSNNHRMRNELNILYFQDLAKTMPKWPWKYKYKNKKGFIR